MGSPGEENWFPHLLRIADDNTNAFAEQNTSGFAEPCTLSGASMEAPVNEKSAGISPRLVCSSCSERFVNPRILPCLHTFCAVCISGFPTYPMNKPLNDSGDKDDLSSAKRLSSADSLDSQSFASLDGRPDESSCQERRTILCPDCLREVEVATDVTELPRNYMVERKLTELCFQKIDASLFEFCDSCVNLTEGSEVTVKCVECMENLCSYCEQAHRRQKKTMNHELVSVKEPLRMDSKRNSFTRQMYCSKHTSEELKLFCFKCEEVVCRDCVVLEHRDHDCQFVSPDLFRKEMDGLQKLIRDVVPKVSQVESRLKSVATTKDKLRTRAKHVESEINKFMDTYIKAIEKHRQSLIDQIHNIVQEKERSLNVTELHLKDAKGEAGETCKLVSELIDSGSDMEILTVKKLITGRLNRLNSVSTNHKSKINDFMKFCPFQKADVINDFQMFGKVITRQVSPAHCLVEGDGLSTARIGHSSEMTLTVKDNEDAICTGTDVNIRAWIIYQNDSVKNLPVNLRLKKDGVHNLNFTPEHKGLHFLHVAVNGKPIKESPFKFNVKSKWKEHKGVWQCCTFCQTGGRRDVPCGCRSSMPGGFEGCGHGHGNYPGGPHWSCCGKMVQNSECTVSTSRTSPIRQVTL